MKRLAPNLFDRRYDALVETARSRLPSLAPRWTDYNAHDPGITLIELLAWNTEAQLYSLGRMRRDERAAYAALLGLRPRGPVPARGSLWPDRGDRDAPILSYRQAIVLEPDAAVRMLRADVPRFHPTHRILWSPGRIVALRTRLAGGGIVDLTHSNERGERAFEPFGGEAGPADALHLEFETNGPTGLFPEHRELATGALLSLGVRVAGTLDDPHDDTPPGDSALEVVLRVGTERIPLRVVEDGTRGFMRSGVLLLDVGAVPSSPQRFTLEIAARRGFARPPRVLRVEPNVLPIVEGGTVVREPHVAVGTPMQRIRLDTPGLRHGADADPVRVEIVDDGVRDAWRPVDDLGRCGPDDRVFEVDVADESIVLGNGVNGRMPAAGSTISIDYPYCAGASANTRRGQRWSVRGIDGAFGINPDAVDGGSDAFGDPELRREARRRRTATHALVTAADLESAALALPDLQVARAQVVPRAAAGDGARRVLLIALRERTANREPAEPPETRRWLAAVQRALAANLPLGTRLVVRAPRYRTFTLRARLESEPRRNPDEIASAAAQALRDAFVLVPRDGLPVRALGAAVARHDLAAILRRVPGVRGVLELALEVDGTRSDTLELRPDELPRLDLAASRIDVARTRTGAA